MVLVGIRNRKRNSLLGIGFGSIFFLSIFTTAVAPQAHAAVPHQSEFCRRLLTEAEIAALPHQIKADIAARTEPLREGRAEIMGTSGTPIDVLEGINRELAKPILDASKRTVTAKVDELTRKWATAVKDTIKLRYETYKKQKIQVTFDADGLPEVALVQNNRELALALVRSAKNKMGASEIEQGVAQALIDAAKKKFNARFKVDADEVITAADQALVASKNSVSPDWNSVIRAATEPKPGEASSPYQQLLNELNAIAPTEFFTALELKSVVEAKKLAATPIDPVAATARLNDRGVPELVISEIGVRASYDVELGTVVLESARGMLSVENGMLMVVDHGDGTVKSNASSWKYVMAKFFSSSLNAVAMNLPKAGIGMDIKGFHKTVAYLQHRYQVLRARAPAKPGEPLMPMILFGRSMGSAKGFAHSFLYGGQGGLVDAYIFTSFSNPLTMELQLRNVYDQVAKGTLPGVVPESLKNAETFSREMRQELEKIEAQDPGAFKNIGDDQLFLQGDADEDGGPSVVEDLFKFVKRFAPRAHVYLFENMLTRYGIRHLDKIDPERFEGTHTLASNLPNMTRDQFKGAVEAMTAAKERGELNEDELQKLEAYTDIYEKVPPEDLPALQEQYWEMMAVVRGFMDYRADHGSHTIREWREKTTGGKTYLEQYLEQSKITMAEINATAAGRGSRAARARKVLEFWKAERAKRP